MVGVPASEFYDPSTNVWQATRNQPSGFGPLALLDTGNVLLTVNGSVSGELYDPSTNEWTVTGSMHTLRRAHTLTLLVNGKILAAGGNRPVGEITNNSAELYTP